MQHYFRKLSTTHAQNALFAKHIDAVIIFNTWTYNILTYRMHAGYYQAGTTQYGIGTAIHEPNSVCALSPTLLQVHVLRQLDVRSSAQSM